MSPGNIAYLKMVADHQAALFCFIRSVAPGLSDTDDVLQETNIVLWRKMENFRPGTDFKAFAFRIAYLKTMEALRRCSRDAAGSFDERTAELIAGSWDDAPVPDAARLGALERCLGRLGENDREMIERRYARGRTLRSLADEARVAEGALQQKFFRLRRTLRDCIRKTLSTGEEHA